MKIRTWRRARGVLLSLQRSSISSSAAFTAVCAEMLQVRYAKLRFPAHDVDDSARSGSEGLDVETGKVSVSLSLRFRVRVEF
jgi:hypothetical protein